MQPEVIDILIIHCTQAFDDIFLWLVGGSGGIGAETARVLALRGVHVVLGVRNLAAGINVRDALIKENPSAKFDVMELDLSSIQSVKNFASDFQSKNLPLNILV